MTRLIAFFIGILCISTLFGQEEFSLQSSLRVTNYTQKEYKANAQIFDIAQSENGIMYFANQRGVLQYDGSEWRTLFLPNKIESFSALPIGEDVVVANTSGLGRFRPNQIGQLIYEDLTSKFSDESTPLYGVFNDSEYFFTYNLGKLYVLDQDFSKVNQYTDANDGIGALNLHSDGLYFRGKDNSIVVFKEGKFKSYSFGVLLESAIVSIVEFDGQKLAITQDGTFYEFSNGAVTRLFKYDGGIVKYVHNINDEYLSLGFYVEGVVILDKAFQARYSVTTEKGLKDGTILCQFIDREHNLWLGTSNGISKIDLMSPVVKYANLFSDATIEDITYFKDNVVIATGGGAYEINNQGEIAKIKGIVDDCYGLNQMIFDEDTSLYISALYDVFKFDLGEDAKKIASGGPYNVRKSPVDSARAVVLNYDGLQLLSYENNRFVEIDYVRDFCQGEPFNFIIQENGLIWIGTKPNDGVYSIQIKDLFKGDLSFSRYYVDQGLPEGQTFLFDYMGEVYTATDEGIYKFDQGHFVPYNGFGIDFSKTGQGVHRINADPQGNVWMVLFKDNDNTYEIGYSVPQGDGTYEWHSEYFMGYDEYIVHSLFHADEDVTWLGGPGGLMSFDKKRIRSSVNEFQSLVRYVHYGDSTLYGGNGQGDIQIQIPYDAKKSIEFHFTSNSYFAEEQTVYSYKMEGFDSDWSSWSTSKIEDYSLTEGTYVFKVKAKNALGVESEVASFEFEILPPWYRTMWAYTLFLLGAVVIIYVIVRLSIRRIKLQNIRLEQIVEERTEEVVAQKAEAEKQRDIAEHQKHLVEEKNLEIVDSINYAKRLQTAILTPVKTISETFTDSFIMYLPKDIVAGDFYWTNLAKLNKRATKNLIAAADCTGHGVPGAMVSVVCSNALDRSVKEFGLSQPGEILDKTTDLVIATFEQSDEDVKDGMDIALCAFEKKEGFTELQYAGANNPLWLITKANQIEVNGNLIEPIMNNAEQNLFEIKATKQPVGKYAERKPFENNIIKLARTTNVYTFTDGFADQFGGEKGKKYKYKPFKELLLSIHSEPMQDQAAALEAEFSQWKGSYEQIDDVCVIGIRVSEGQ